jgi:DNA polymerase III epsilon subunit-like protein
MIHQPCPEILKNKKLIALDIETTGLNIMFNTIIELGVIEIINGKVKTEYSKLFGGGHSSMYLVRKIHHIKDSERKGKKTFKECAEKIASFLSDSIIITHNGNAFDIPMIEQKLHDAGYEIKNFKSIDTLQLVRKMRKEENIEEEKKQTKRNTLGSLCKEFGLIYGGENGDKSHRGLEDAEATVDLLFYLINNDKIKLSI